MLNHNSFPYSQPEAAILVQPSTGMVTDDVHGDDQHTDLDVTAAGSIGPDDDAQR